MGFGMVPVVDAPLPGEGFGDDGKILYMALETFDQLAEEAQVPSLSTYLDHRPEPTDIDEIDDIDQWEIAISAWRKARTDWYSPADGLRTVEGMLSALSRDGSSTPLKGRLASVPEMAVCLPQILKPLGDCLPQAVATGVRFRLHVD